MIPFKTALDTILSLPLEVGTEEVSLLEASGRILCDPPHAPWPLPRFDNSSMDGFAVSSADLRDASSSNPILLPIIGESAAGRSFSGSMPSGTALRISTGAPLPSKPDAVVPIEQVRVLDSGGVEFNQPARPEVYIRRRGSDIDEGSPLLPRGTIIASAQLAFLSSFNLSTVRVFRRPRVAILTSGEEIRLLGEKLKDDQIIGSSLYYLEEELARCHCEPRLFGVALDDAAAFRELFEEALAWCDFIVTTAGVSVGAHDVVGEVVESLNGHVHFWKVAVRPGKPMLLASYAGKHHFGFPGNPVSTCCNTEIFLKPFLRRAFGMDPVEHMEPIIMRLAADCPVDKQRLFFVYATTELRAGALYARPLPNQNSGNLANPARADALIMLKPADAPLKEGSEVQVIRIRDGL